MCSHSIFVNVRPSYLISFDFIDFIILAYKLKLLKVYLLSVWRDDIEARDGNLNLPKSPCIIK